MILFLDTGKNAKIEIELYILIAFFFSCFLKHDQLETDSQILLDKASSALSKYNMHAVVANELATRKEEVTVVTLHGKTCIRREPGTDIENAIIQLLAERHAAHIQDTLQNQAVSCQ